MDLNNTPLKNIKPKAESWKFSPLKELSMEDYKASSFSLNEFRKLKMGLGPSPERFEIITWEELEQDGIVSLSIQKPSPLKAFESELKRAEIPSEILQTLESYDSIFIEFLKNPPSHIWANIDSFNAKTHFKFNKNSSQTFCFMEQEKTYKKISSLSFELQQGASLNIGFDLAGAQNSFRKIDFYNQKESRLNCFSLFKSPASYKRLEVFCALIEEKCDVAINGLSLVKDSSIFDYHSNIMHLANDQLTSQKYNTINEDKAKSIFMGRVHLSEKSSGASVEQLNQNLILEKKASVDAQPELNIYQDNVKATHGSTTGQLDAEHLFYLNSRGFSTEKAKSLLLKGFAKSTFLKLQNKKLYNYFSDKVFGVNPDV